MSKYAVEKTIRQAIEDGKFDNLPGAGKPLKLDQNPHQDPEWRVAHHLLKSGGFSLPWIERLGEITDNLQLARTSLARSWAWFQRDQSNIEDWQAATNLFRQSIQSINQQIRIYNLEVPNHRFQIQLVEIQQEIEQIKKEGNF